jgi:hypothetical protein
MSIETVFLKRQFIGKQLKVSGLAEFMSAFLSSPLITNPLIAR